ncbi:MAG: MBL fold metallo-hydrolase [Acidobacteria bacterium]|nr:MAG: MBL fold metallo-hydrolase [Acidobacteriota bacterium]
MLIRQFYLGCLAHASYLVADEGAGVAAVVDPQRDIEIYLEEAERRHLQIRHVFLTHFHADFLAGHLELRERTGAEICLGARAEAQYPFRAFADGEELALGAGRLRVLHTPGHTPESISLLVFEPDAAEPKAVLTGDTLFIGDVGRPDLRAALGWTAQDLGALLYDSLQRKLLPLPDATLLYPAHGAGSLCGKQLSKETVSTLGEQRRLNYALQPMSREEFLRIVLADQPDAPGYFTYDAVRNTQAHPSLEVSLEQQLRPLDVTEVEQARQRGAILLDTRSPIEHARAHWRGAVNIPLDGAFATWCGTILRPEEEIVLIAQPGREREAGVRLGRIGFDRIAGYLNGGMQALDGRDNFLNRRERLSPAELPRPGRVLDVRSAAERASGFIPGSLHIPLSQLQARRQEVPGGEPLLVYCQSGYRSSIASSLLQRWNVAEVSDLEGGYQAWELAHNAGSLSPKAPR